ncbi:hypothetical protein [Chryseobacterium sp. JK1]|uniref:hypothetical protein n=1 Tax=Chryseobacterium sp. JK1 TaxID=874294 RepID=UPI003D688643
MKKILFLIFVLIGTFVFSQEFVLTEDNYKLKDDKSKNYVVLEFPGKKIQELFSLVKNNLPKKYDLKFDHIIESENNQIIVEITSQSSRTIFINRKGANVWKVVNKYELNFKDEKIMIKPSFMYLLNTETKSEASIGYLFNSRGIVRIENAVSFAEAFTNTFVRNFDKELIKHTSEKW